MAFERLYKTLINWEDNPPSEKTNIPKVNAANLNHMENGIIENDKRICELALGYNDLQAQLARDKDELYEGFNRPKAGCTRSSKAWCNSTSFDIDFKLLDEGGMVYGNFFIFVTVFTISSDIITFSDDYYPVKLHLVDNNSLGGESSDVDSADCKTGIFGLDVYSNTESETGDTYDCFFSKYCNSPGFKTDTDGRKMIVKQGNTTLIEAYVQKVINGNAIVTFSFRNDAKHQIDIRIQRSIIGGKFSNLDALGTPITDSTSALYIPER